MSDHEPLEAQLARLKAEFDGSFALSPPNEEGAAEALLLLRIGEDRLAVRASEIRGLVPCRQVVAVPSRAPEVLGIVSIRGGLSPVLSLARLIGYRADPEPPRWLLLCGSEPLGIAFGRFDGQVRVPAAALQEVAPGKARSPYLRQLFTSDGITRPVISIASIVRDLAGHSAKESQP